MPDPQYTYLLLAYQLKRISLGPKFTVHYYVFLQCAWKYEKENMKKKPAKLAYFSKIEEFFPFYPDCPKRTKNENSFWKCVSRYICVLICGRNIVVDFGMTFIEIVKLKVFILIRSKPSKIQVHKTFDVDLEILF